jgi:hypothetical protein
MESVESFNDELKQLYKDIHEVQALLYESGQLLSFGSNSSLPSHSKPAPKLVPTRTPWVSVSTPNFHSTGLARRS